MADASAFEAAGLYDPTAPDATSRLALLEYLTELGCTIDDMLAVDPSELPVLASIVPLWPSRARYTVDEMAARTGATHESILIVWRAAGFPDPGDAAVFTDRDVAMFSILDVGATLLGADILVQFMRVLGSAAARVADAATSAFVVNVGPGAIAQDPSGLELARANATAIELLPGLVDGFDVLLRHFIDRQRRPLPATGGGVELQSRSIGFVDLVGSTAFTQRLDAATHARALSIFDATATDIVSAHATARIVKLIGDEVMFVAEDAVTATRIALDLVETFAHHDVLPPVRAAIASGEVVARDGDYAGSVVNLAARAIKAAEPSSLLVDATTAEALAGERFACDDTGNHQIKGFASPVRLFEVRDNS